MLVRDFLVLAESSSNENAAGRGGPGPSPVGHEELQLMIAALEQSDEPRNPFKEHYLAYLRRPLLKYLSWHPVRAQNLRKHPRRASNPPGAAKENWTVMNVIHTQADGLRRTLATSFHLDFDKDDVDAFSNAPLHVIREALQRGEDQPFTPKELVCFKLILARECRYLKGNDIAWVKPATGD
jgi:hypothetical protein